MARQILVAPEFSIEHMKLNPVQKSQFVEFLAYSLQRSRPLGFYDFNKICGISRQQWEIFRLENMEKHSEWVVE